MARSTAKLLASATGRASSRNLTASSASAQNKRRRRAERRSRQHDGTGKTGAPSAVRKIAAHFANCERFSDLLDGASVQPARHYPFIRLQQMTALALIPAARGTEIERQGSTEAV